MNFDNYSKDSTFSSLVSLLNHYKFKHSRLSILTLMKKNPHFSNIRLISDTLDELNIENKVYTINPEQIRDLDTPFIAHVKVNRGEFVLVREINNENVVLVGARFKKKILTIARFQSLWSGVALFVDDEKIPKSNEKSYLFKEFLYTIQSNKFLFFSLSIIALFCLKFLNKNTLFFENLFTLANTYGILISIFIIIKTYLDGNFLNRFCKVGRLIDCNSTLQSQFAKPFNWLSLGEWGFIFFLISFISGLLNYSSSIPYLFVLFCIGVATTLVTISLQIWAKRFCLFCMLLVIAVWIGFSILLFNLIHSEVSINIKGFIFFISLSFLVFFGLLIIRMILLDSLKNNNLKKLIVDSSTFKVLLQNSPSFSIPDELKPMLNLSNNVSAHRLDLILSLSCSHCAQTFIAAKKLLGVKDNISLSIILYPNVENKEEVEFVNRLISAYRQVGFEVFMNLLSDWYSYKYMNIKEWTKKCSFSDDTIHLIVQEHIKWCSNQKFPYLPIVAIDGHLLHRVYSIDDLKYLI